MTTGQSIIVPDDIQLKKAISVINDLISGADPWQKKQVVNY